MKKCFKMPQPLCLLSFNQIRRGEQREKTENNLSFRFKISDGECPFHWVCTCSDFCAKTLSWWYLSGKNVRLAARSEERSPWPFSKRKRSVKATSPPIQLTKGDFALQLCENGELRRHVGRGVVSVPFLFFFFFIDVIKS